MTSDGCAADPLPDKGQLTMDQELIKFSRHAKRRMRLYKINAGVVMDILHKSDLTEGRHELVQAVDGMQYPLKIIISVEDDIATVITCYPLKKGIEK